MTDKKSVSENLNNFMESDVYKEQEKLLEEKGKFAKPYIAPPAFQCDPGSETRHRSQPSQGWVWEMEYHSYSDNLIVKLS